MTYPKIAVGLYIPANPPLGLIRAYALFARPYDSIRCSPRITFKSSFPRLFGTKN